MPTLEKYNLFIKIITNSITINTPAKKVIKAIKHWNPVPWWDSECYLLKKQRKEAYRKWEKSLLMEDFINYNKVVAQIKRKLSNKRKRTVFVHLQNQLMSKPTQNNTF